MNKFFCFILGLSLLVTACNQSANNNSSDAESIMKDSAKFTTIQWQDTVIDFGTKKMGDIVNITFLCTNTGNKPLYLFDVRPGCGCTLVDYTKQPIKPGDQGKIEAKFDTNRAHPGTVHKAVYVHSNTSNHSPSYLSFTGTIAISDSATAHK